MQLYTVQGVFTVSRPLYTRGCPVYNTGFVCPKCLKPWAQAKWVGGDELPQRIQPTYCEACVQKFPHFLHPDISPVGGSLLDNSHANGYDFELLEVLPPALLYRELALHLLSPTYSKEFA